MVKSRNKNRGNMGNPLVELTEAEWEIMKVVWDIEPCAAGTVQETLALRRTPYGGTRNRAYSTVKTTMDRMAEKGLLEIEKIRNLQLFKSCISEIDAKRGEFRKMLKRAFDGAMTPMMQFLIEHEGLSKNEASQLRDLVSKADTKKRKNKKRLVEKQGE